MERNPEIENKIANGEYDWLATKHYVEDLSDKDREDMHDTWLIDVVVSKQLGVLGEKVNPHKQKVVNYIESLKSQVSEKQSIDAVTKQDGEREDVAENDSALQQVVFKPVSDIDEQLLVLKGLMAKIKVIDGRMQLYDFIGCIKRADFKAMYAAAKKNKNIKRLFFTIECAKVWFHDGWEEQAAASIGTTTKNMRSYRLEEINNGDYTDWYEKMFKLFGKSNKKK